jgi:hypothetical protein
MGFTDGSRAWVAVGAATANPAVAKKHRRVSERLPEVAIGISFLLELVETQELDLSSLP